jgi:hypothetical protein
VTYTKFRGRGGGALEKTFGADGIVEVKIENLTTGKIHGKGVLFQAKKVTDKNRTRLTDQAKKMEKVAAHGSAIFEYGPEEYIGYDASELVNGHDRLTYGRSRNRLGNYLADRFLPCDVGKKGMFYDAVGKTIVYTNEDGDMVRARAMLKHRIRIEVASK